MPPIANTNPASLPRSARAGSVGTCSLAPVTTRRTRRSPCRFSLGIWRRRSRRQPRSCASCSNRSPPSVPSSLSDCRRVSRRPPRQLPPTPPPPSQPPHAPQASAATRGIRPVHRLPRPAPCVAHHEHVIACPTRAPARGVTPSTRLCRRSPHRALPQEALELSAQNVGAGASGPLAGAAVAWEAAITKAVHEVRGGAGRMPAGVLCQASPPPADGAADDTDGADSDEGGFVQLVCRQMMGIVMLVYVRKWLWPACTAPRVTSVGTGTPAAHLPPRFLCFFGGMGAPHLAHAQRATHRPAAYAAPVHPPGRLPTSPHSVRRVCMPSNPPHSRTPPPPLAQACSG